MATFLFRIGINLFGVFVVFAICSAAVALILAEGNIVFIYRIVCKMHEQILKIGSPRLNVRLSGKTGNSLFVNEYPHRINAVKQHINSEVVFQVVYEMWLVQVLLDDVSSFGCAIFDNFLAIP